MLMKQMPMSRTFSKRFGGIIILDFSRSREILIRTMFSGVRHVWAMRDGRKWEMIYAEFK
jgi:hypothetical protein